MGNPGLALGGDGLLRVSAKFRADSERSLVVVVVVVVVVLNHSGATLALLSQTLPGTAALSVGSEAWSGGTEETAWNQQFIIMKN